MRIVSLLQQSVTRPPLFRGGDDPHNGVTRAALGANQTRSPT
ncbi:hypothetical protein A33K_18935 [Burkholderia humptydooensis MSMB43]|uniref:Uncharacterized protein n=1 Tax=Burkholderia humptydooensis MSMB43 TaxID=441157 RepID=A0ABN0FWR9_9BURK|nr:hypothetical protein A33K_18935 [Burkholderia humptydooensis MSMB43]